MSLPGDPSLPPGVTDRQIEGTICPQCGGVSCGCAEDDDDRSYAERIEEEKAERGADFDRDEGLI